MEKTTHHPKFVEGRLVFFTLFETYFTSIPLNFAKSEIGRTFLLGENVLAIKLLNVYTHTPGSTGDYFGRLVNAVSI